MAERTYQRSLVTQALITEECRTNRTDEAAWDEAVRRLRAEYEAVLDGWKDEPEQPILVLALYMDRPVEDRPPAIPPLPTEDGRA